MLFFELFTPKGTLSAEQRRRISERLITEVVAAEGAPAAIIERGRAITQVVVHEPDVWVVGGRPLDADGAPRFVVRVSVPGGHLTDATRAELVARVTRVLTEVALAPRLYQEPNAWVHIVEIPDGNIGLFGHVMRTDEIVQMTVTGERAARDSASGDEQAPATAVDPICGMTVALTAEAITLEHEGTTYAFCATACRDIFAAAQVA
jgi:phenylpyruvate tautomerase PptA (4-oxalocrotonate tautomerase family)/YHS domain-containing protein